MRRNYPCWRIYELRQDRCSRVRYVGLARSDVAPWREIWRLRDRIDSALTRWFRELEGREPSESTFLGLVPLDETGAVRIARAHIEALQAAGMADLNVIGESGHARPVVKIEGDTIIPYASEGEAAKGEGISLEGVVKARWQGRDIYDGTAAG